MGFYGNITNTSNTTFQFDKVYPNRLSMDANINNDGIFIGRYVLVEYDQDAAYPIIYTEDGVNFYSSPNTTEEISRIKFKSGKRPVSETQSEDVFYLGEIGQVQDIEYNPDKTIKSIEINFYQCSNNEDDQDGVDAIFSLLTKTSSNNTYINNFAIDEAYESWNEKFKGYDSTVWVKTTINTGDGLITKYVNIADLNSVVPTFDIAADAPTMEPITPHFDADSTNVYYKLHMQQPFGFRVKENNTQSDETTTYYETIYDKNGNITSQNVRKNVNADIFYNKNALEYKPNDISNRVETAPDNQNEIKLSIGKSNTYDTRYQHYTEGDVQGDIQELSIHLPSVGYMVSQGWDVIHGPDRNDDMREFRINENNQMLDSNGQITEDKEKARCDSLQGRLNSIAAIASDEIPVKREADGRLVGSKINGGKISNSNLSGKNDDAWIETIVDGKTNTISIHHTFNSKKNGNEYKKLVEKEMDNDDSTNYDINGNKDTYNIITPIVDATGHVVGKNTETVILPYGFKTISTNGRGASTDENATTNPVTTNIVADNTQDTLTIDSGNRWVRLDTDATNDKITISHDIHNITKTKKTDTDMNGSNVTSDVNNKITIQDLQFDDAGHVTHNQNHTYVLPYGFKTITTNGRSADETENATSTPAVSNIIADNTQDSLAINSGNKWIRIDTDATNDKITISHDIHNFDDNAQNDKYYGLLQNEDINTLNNDNTFEVPCFKFDKAGHITGARTHTVTIPENFTKITVGNSLPNTVSNTSHTSGTIEANSLIDELKINPGNKWIQMTVDSKDDSFSIQHYVEQFSETNPNKIDYNNANTKEFSIQALGWDNAGHLTSSAKTTYQLPDNFKTIAINNSGADTITSSVAKDGALTATTLVDTATFDTGNRWITMVANTDKKVTIYHAAPNANSDSTNTTQTGNETPKFGETFKIPEIKYDETGHIFGKSTHTVKIPLITLTNDNSGNVMTGLSLDLDSTNNTSTGAFAITKDNLSSLKLDGYSKKSDNSNIASTDTLAEALSKLQTQIIEEEDARAAAINSLDYSDGTDGYGAGYSSTAQPNYIISKITQTDGKIAVERAAAGSLVLTGYNIGTSAEKVNDVDTINSAFGKLQSQINAVVGSGEIAENFNTIQKIADWLKANDSDADKIIDSIAKLNGANTVEGSVAHSIKTAIEDLDSETEVSNTTKNYLTGITIVNGKITDKTEGTLGSAAFTDSDAYATAAQGKLAVSAIQPTTEFDYGEEEKVTIIGLIAKIKDLEAEIDLLKAYHTTSTT